MLVFGLNKICIQYPLCFHSCLKSSFFQLAGVFWDYDAFIHRKLSCWTIQTTETYSSTIIEVSPLGPYVFRTCCIDTTPSKTLWIVTVTPGKPVTSLNLPVSSVEDTEVSCRVPVDWSAVVKLISLGIDSIGKILACYLQRVTASCTSSW